MLGPHPGHGPAPAEWWDQDSGQSGFCRPGGSPEKWLVLKVLVTLRWALLAQFSAFPFNGADLFKELKTSTAILSIGIGSLDKLLYAYLYTGEVTGITGGPGSSKTQLLQARTLDQEEQAGALQRIQVVPAFDIFQMPKREYLALMLQLAHKLKTVAQDLSMAVAVTSHLISDRDSRQLKPALKCSWSFVPSTQLFLDIGQGTGASGCRRLACLTTSPRLPTGFQETVNTGTCGAPEQSPALQGDHT
ncbi:DNA repair protein RAD51-like protein 4 [Bos mutus]|uniref:DNA repair protein RAD51-like protein 4 n=1 Tax=Bos mutus TaxID=72004 RepID=L8IWP9_9CETA|nr:DNA repair protein RAD51-like protein 4 [Bos mutus]